MAEPVLLDTCAAIWLMLMNEDPMSADSRASAQPAVVDDGLGRSPTW
jgi:hypothetical protein